MVNVGKYTIHGLFEFSIVMFVLGGGGVYQFLFLETIFFVSRQDETRPPVNVQTELSECGLKRENERNKLWVLWAQEWIKELIVYWTHHSKRETIVGNTATGSGPRPFLGI